jgi:hypothetical protein
MEPVRAEVTPKAGVWVEAERLREAVRKAGFKPGAIQYIVRGQLTEWQGQPAVTLSGTNRVLLLQAEPKTPAAFQQARQLLLDSPSGTATVEGQWPDKEPRGGPAGTPGTLRVSRVEVAREK